MANAERSVSGAFEVGLRRHLELQKLEDNERMCRVVSTVLHAYREGR